MNYCPNKLEVPCKCCGDNNDWENETEKTGWDWRGGFMGAYYHCANCDEPLYKSLTILRDRKHG